MSMQREHIAPRSIDRSASLGSKSMAEAMLRRIVGDLECGELAIETPSGDRMLIVGRKPGPQAKVTINTWRCLWRVFASSDIGAADAYIAGEWSSPNLASLLALAGRNASMSEPLKFGSAQRFWHRLRHAMNRNTRRGSRRNISAHYDLGNEFYRRWLDPGMTYSSALYTGVGQTLEEAQDAKLDRIVELMDVKGGEKVLEIGCGWGGLAERLLRHDCAVTGITLSAEQLTYAKVRLKADVAAGRCDLRLQDYRDVQGEFDRIVSIEMIEAVGEAYWPTYFEKLRRCLRPGGIAVLQVITIDASRFDNYRRNPDFIQKYIFPGGMLPTAEIIKREPEKVQLELVAQEQFGADYARTLEEWQLRFQDTWPEIQKLGFDERFKRIWEYYLAYCQAGFQTGSIDVGLYKFARGASL